MSKHPHVFDELAKDLARGISRREALRRFAGGVVGALLASLGGRGLWLSPAHADSTSAACLQQAADDYQMCVNEENARYKEAIAASNQAHQDCKTQTCAGKTGKELGDCYQACADAHQQAVQSDEQEHSSFLDECATVRDAAQSICRGECQNSTECPGGLVCVPIGGQKKCARCQNDSECSDYGSNFICSQNGECMECPEGEDACLGACIDPETDAHNCGGCAAEGSFPMGEDCTLTGKTCCSVNGIGTCTDTQTDDMNCGGCVAAGHGEDCTLTGKHCCNGSCVDTRNDVNNCGGCGVQCGGDYPICCGSTCWGCFIEVDGVPDPNQPVCCICCDTSTETAYCCDPPSAAINSPTVNPPSVGPLSRTP